MGYTIELVDAYGDVVQVNRHAEGSTYLPNGTTLAEITITYNYAKHFRETIDESLGIRWLYGMKAKHCIPVLHGAVRELGTLQDEDYWAKTPGNAGHMLSILLKWAKQHPEATFRGD